jgi:hypothetical protein
VTCTSSCGYACNAGHADCNTQANDGCEVDTLTDKNNCGGCGTVCGAGQVCTKGTCRTPPKCSDLVTTASVWGLSAKGLALGPYTNGTLDWIGCAGDIGCTPADFFCTDEANGIYFGSSNQVLRALVDPGNAGGASYPTSYSSCCSAGSPRNVCNAPRGDNDGVGGINAGTALCRALGFTGGTVVSEASDNACPRPYSTAADGSSWTSNFSFAGPYTYGMSYRCTK